MLLPKKEKTKEQEAYLKIRSEDHERLFRGEFFSSEEKCREFHDRIVRSCRSHVFKERKLSVDIKGFLFEGTPDFFAYDKESKSLYVLDYKTGYKHVVAWENTQLLSYACMILLSKKFDWEIQNFCLAILNTQSDIVSTFQPSLKTVLNHVARIEKSLSFTYEQNTFYSIKGRWCQFCPSKAYCPLHRDVAEIKRYMDHDTDQLLYAKEKRSKELADRIRELKVEEGLSEVFDYTLAYKKRFKYRKDAPDDLMYSRQMTPVEAKKMLDAVTFNKYFEEEETPSLAIGERKP